MREQKGITLIALIITIIVMLILAGVSISLTVGEDGVINKANQAVEQTTMAQIRERAELVKASLALDIETEEDRNIIVTQEFAERLLKEVGGRIEGSRVITKNDEYAVTLKGVNLEVEVSKYEGDILDIGLLLTPSYEITGNKLKISGTLMGQSEIIEHLQNLAENATMTEKDYGAAQYMITLEDYDHITEVSTLDDLVVKYLNHKFGFSHTTIDGYLNDSEVETYAKNTGLIGENDELAAEHLYAYVFQSTASKEDIIEENYGSYLNYCVLKPILNEYNSLKIEVRKDDGTLIKSESFNTSTGTTIDNITKGIYEISIKTTSNKLELANEKIIINKIED